MIGLTIATYYNRIRTKTFFSPDSPKSTRYPVNGNGSVLAERKEKGGKRAVESSVA